MENKDIRTEARILVSELLLEKNINKYMERLKDKKRFVFKHCINVAYLTAEITQQIYSDQEEIKNIVTGALLHDIGKLYVPDKILYKRGRLTDDEYELVKKHTIWGYDLIKEEAFTDLTKDIVLSHHEKSSGAGYPYHKKGEEISQGVQIVTVCDMYDALTEKRTYGDENSAYSALKIIAEEKIEDSYFLLLAGCPDK